MPVSIYDSAMDDAERARQDFEGATDTYTKVQCLRVMEDVAKEFSRYAEELDQFVLAKENEMMDEGEI